MFHVLGGIFSLDKPWKSESVSTFDVPFMSMVEHHGRHGGRDTMVNSHRGTPWIFSYTKVLIFLFN